MWFRLAEAVCSFFMHIPYSSDEVRYLNPVASLWFSEMSLLLRDHRIAELVTNQ
jgi:hypothetical protein